MTPTQSYINKRKVIISPPTQICRNCTTLFLTWSFHFIIITNSITIKPTSSEPHQLLPRILHTAREFLLLPLASCTCHKRVNTNIYFCQLLLSSSDSEEGEISLIVEGTPKLREKEDDVDFQVFLSEI